MADAEAVPAAAPGLDYETAAAPDLAPLARRMWWAGMLWGVVWTGLCFGTVWRSVSASSFAGRGTLDAWSILFSFNCLAAMALVAVLLLVRPRGVARPLVRGACGAVLAALFALLLVYGHQLLTRISAVETLDALYAAIETIAMHAGWALMPAGLLAVSLAMRGLRRAPIPAASPHQLATGLALLLVLAVAMERLASLGNLLSEGWGVARRSFVSGGGWFEVSIELLVTLVATMILLTALRYRPSDRVILIVRVTVGVVLLVMLTTQIIKADRAIIPLWMESSVGPLGRKLIGLHHMSWVIPLLCPLLPALTWPRRDTVSAPEK